MVQLLVYQKYLKVLQISRKLHKSKTINFTDIKSLNTYLSSTDTRSFEIQASYANKAHF